MKIKLQPPSLPSSPVEVTKTPAAPVPVPVPVPVPNFTGSTFVPSPGAERRFSVRFMNALPQQLQLANVPKELGDALQARFGAMNRSELDRFGRLAETLMSTRKPAEALGLFEAFSSLHTTILPGGHRIEPNAEGSWTVTPKGKDPFELPSAPGSNATLDDGTQLAVDTLGKLRAGAQVINREVAEAAQRIPAEQLMKAALALGASVGLGVGAAAVGVGVAVVGAGISVGAGAANPAGVLVATAGVAATSAVVAAAVTVIESTPQLMNGVADLARAAGFKEASVALRDGSQSLDAFLKQAPISLALKIVLIAAAVIIPTNAVKLLEQAGRSAAPSPRADPDLERGLILLKAAQGTAADELSHFARDIRGRAQEGLRSAMGR